MITEVRKCSPCGRVVLHNPMKGGGWRCTYCGHPITTNVVMKKTYQEDLKARQINRARALNLE